MKGAYCDIDVFLSAYRTLGKRFLRVREDDKGSADDYSYLR